MTATTTPIISGSSIHNDMITWRRWLHQHPELSYKEFKTSDYIAEVLTSLEIPFHRGLGGTGIVASIKGKQDGNSIGLRADIDALPVDEANNFDHKSLHHGHMHACGHDGHTTMLLGAAAHLIKNNDFNGTVHCIFQPAEEGDAGAKRMMEEGLFEMFPCNEVYGMHNWPGLPAGQFAVHDTNVMAAVRTLEITITGKGGHAAIPHNTIDPVVIGAQLITALQTVVSRNMSPLEAAVISITTTEAGFAHNVIPDVMKLGGTLRFYQAEHGEMLLRRIQELVETIPASFGATGEFKIIGNPYPATINTPENAAYSAEAAAQVVGVENVQRKLPPSMAAEDFGYMLEELPGAYIWVGNGEGEGGCMLHNALYDFNDEVSPLGSSYWVELVNNRLGVREV